MADPLDRLMTELGDSLSGLSGQQLRVAPLRMSAKWNIQQIVEHLQLTFDSTASLLSARLEKGRPTLTKPTAAQHLAQFVILTVGRFPQGRSAPDAVTPALDLPLRTADELFTHARTSLVQIRELTAEGQHLFGNRRSVSHFALGPLSMQQWRRFHEVHGKHHIRQIWAIRKQQSF